MLRLGGHTWGRQPSASRPMTRTRRDPQLNLRARRRLAAQVRAEEPACWLCGLPIDTTLDRQRHPLGSVIDEITPRSAGGSALDRSNVHHAHRLCNGIRCTKPVTGRLRAACRAAVLDLLGQPVLSRCW